MLATLKSDLRKIFTVRSTYFMTLSAMLIAALISFYLNGYKGNTGSPASLPTDQALSVIVSNNAVFASIFISIIAILHMAHEYRYNTIMYTLTANASRTKSLISKCLAVTIMALVIGTIVSIFGIVMYLIGLNVRGADLPIQDFEIMSNLFHVSFYFVGYALMSLFIAVIIRSLVGAIAFYFIYSTTLEQIVGTLILKDKSQYLPFSALNNSLSASYDSSVGSSSSKFIITTLIYIAVLAIISWLLYMRRDAN